MHFHNQVEVVYCLKKCVNVTVENQEYILKPGDAAVVFPNQSHSYSNKLLDEDRMVMIIFEPDLTEEYYIELTSMIPVNPVVKKEELPEFFPAFIEMFWTECRTDSVSDRKFKAYADVVLECLLPKMQIRSAERDMTADLTGVVLNYIDAHYRKHISLDSVSRDLGVNKWAISQMFSQQVNSNFVSYVNSRRVNYSKKLLRTTEKSLKEIADESGFQSMRSFHRIFKERTGRTPVEYRRENREREEADTHNPQEQCQKIVK